MRRLYSVVQPTKDREAQRAAMRTRNQQLRDGRRAKGLCPYDGRRPEPGHKLCRRCIDTRHAYYADSRRLVAAGSLAIAVAGLGSPQEEGST